MSTKPRRTTTAVRFPDELHERLRQAADERELSMNFLVVKAVADFLERLLPVEEIRLTRLTKMAPPLRRGRSSDGR